VSEILSTKFFVVLFTFFYSCIDYFTIPNLKASHCAIMRRPAGTVDGGGTPQEWFRDLPIVTKLLFTSTLLSGVVTTFGLIDPMALIFYWPNIYEKFEIWRLLTAFTFAGSFSMSFAMHIYMLYQNSMRYESNPFNSGARGTSADYLFMIIFSMGVLCVLGYIFDTMMLSEPLLYVIMYTWSRKEPDAQTNIFGFKFKALYLPWVYVAIRMLMGNSITGPLLGIGCGTCRKSEQCRTNHDYI
jgi:hypothetical protein